MQNKILLRECMAELCGTLFILLFGDGACAMNSLFNLGEYVTVSFGWGLAVLFGILVSTRISGAHLNPAVTLSLVLTKRFPARKLPFYVLSQMIGAFLGAAIVYYFYQAKFAIVDPNLSHSSAIFTTFPAVNAFIPSLMSELIASAILLFGILTIVDHFTLDKAQFLAPFTVALLVIAIGLSFGGMHGYGMNPARDFSPRLLITLLGFQNNGLTDNSYIWTQGIIGPLIGGPLGAFLYDYTIGRKINIS
ncbi:MAG: glycerol uptake facilitator protein [Pseudomonadota bacterium]|nr:glycerol uptake facilitator protein [Pseudomonadota bacterium]